ncbi:hypothetical protein J7643_04820 [bacterium]|nr:hypothetical protein [bacterium]
MRLLIPATLAATLLLPAAALACPNCILHGTPREDAAWSKIMDRKEATASVQPAAQPKKDGERTTKDASKR